MREGTQRFGSFLWCWESRLYIALTAFNVHSFCVIEIENQKRQIASRMFFCGIQPRSTISLEMQTEPSLTIAVPWKPAITAAAGRLLDIRIHSSTSSQTPPTDRLENHGVGLVALAQAEGRTEVAHEVRVALLNVGKDGLVD